MGVVWQTILLTGSYIYFDFANLFLFFQIKQANLKLKEISLTGIILNFISTTFRYQWTRSSQFANLFSLWIEIPFAFLVQLLIFYAFLSNQKIINDNENLYRKSIVFLAISIFLPFVLMKMRGEIGTFSYEITVAMQMEAISLFLQVIALEKMRVINLNLLPYLIMITIARIMRILLLTVMLNDAVNSKDVLCAEGVSLGSIFILDFIYSRRRWKKVIKQS